MKAMQHDVAGCRAAAIEERVFAFVALLFVSSISAGCASDPMVIPIDPKAPRIVLAGFTPTPVDFKGGVAVLKVHQAYRLNVIVLERAAAIAKVERRLSWWGGPWPPGSTSFAPIDLTSMSNCCAAVFSPWYFSAANEGSGQTAAFEMWVVDTEGRQSNRLSVDVVSRGSYLFERRSPDLPSTPDSWLVGRWEGSIQNYSPPEGPGRTLEVTAIGPDGMGQGRWGATGQRLGAAMIHVKDSQVYLVTSAGSVVELARTDMDRLEGTFTIKSGQTFPLSLVRGKPALGVFGQ